MTAGAVISRLMRSYFKNLEYGFIRRPFSSSFRKYLLQLTTTNGQESFGDKTKLESYASFGQVTHAPADGKIVKVENSRPDLTIGQTDSKQIIENHIIIEMAEDRFVLLASSQK